MAWQHAFEIADDLIAEQNRKAQAWLDEDYEHLARVLRRRSVDIEDLTARARRISGGRAVVGRWHGRHAVRALPRPRRAARHLRQAGRLRHHLQSRALHARRVAAHPVGQARSARRSCGDYARQRGLHFDAMNSNTFQDQPGPGAVVQVRQPDPSRRGGSRAGHRAQHRVHRDRRRRWVRTRSRSGSVTAATFPGSCTPPRPRALPRQHARDLRRAARRLARVHGAQALRAGVLLDRHQRLGHQLLLRARARTEGACASSTWATTRPTSTSR